MPGMHSSAASALVLNARPTSTAHQISVRRRPESIAARPAPQAASINRISSGSTPLSRDTATNDGNTASENAPTNPATVQNRGATIRYSSATASTGQIPSGISRLSGAKPNSFALNPCSHSPNGGLSTVMKPLGSEETKKKCCHEPSIDLTAAE